MSIVTKLNDSLVKLQGSVDSSNAPQFEEELLAAVFGQTVTLDAEELTDISSAGLRVLLKPEEIAAYKAKACALYDKGIEPLCF